MRKRVVNAIKKYNWKAIHDLITEMKETEQDTVKVPRAALVLAVRGLGKDRPYKTPEAAAVLMIIGNCLSGRKPFDTLLKEKKPPQSQAGTA